MRGAERCGPSLSRRARSDSGKNVRPRGNFAVYGGSIATQIRCSTGAGRRSFEDDIEPGGKALFRNAARRRRNRSLFGCNGGYVQRLSDGIVLISRTRYAAHPCAAPDGGTGEATASRCRHAPQNCAHATQKSHGHAGRMVTALSQPSAMLARQRVLQRKPYADGDASVIVAAAPTATARHVPRNRAVAHRNA